MINSIKVGIFLAIRQIRRASLWTNILISLIMTLTFMNMVVVTGILVGLIEGSSLAYRRQYSSDVLIKNVDKNKYIKNTPELVKNIRATPGVIDLSVRYLTGGQVEANYKQNISSVDEPDALGTQIAGIDAQEEDHITRLSSLIIDGEYLFPDDGGGVLVGTDLLSQYSRGFAPASETLENVKVGNKIRIIINGYTKEVVVRGIVKSKVGQVSRRVYMLDSELRKMLNKTDLNANEIAVKLEPGQKPEEITATLKRTGFEDGALIQTWEESQGSFFKDIGTTFEVLGTFVGSIGIFMAAVTVFIVIFINAINRKRYIGILKAIGIKEEAIEISYMLQSLFYATIGAIAGFLITHGFLQPYFTKNPINFPFSDGILVVPIFGTAIRVLILIMITVAAGYIPAKIVVSKKTLDSILSK